MQHGVCIADYLSYLVRVEEVEFGRRRRVNVMTAVTQQWDGRPPENSRRPRDEDAHGAEDKPYLCEPRRRPARKRVRIRPTSDGGHRLSRKQSAVGSQSQSDCQDALIPEVLTELVESRLSDLLGNNCGVLADTDQQRGLPLAHEVDSDEVQPGNHGARAVLA